MNGNGFKEGRYVRSGSILIYECNYCSWKTSIDMAIITYIRHTGLKVDTLTSFQEAIISHLEQHLREMMHNPTLRFAPQFVKESRGVAGMMLRMREKMEVDKDEDEVQKK